MKHTTHLKQTAHTWKGIFVSLRVVVFLLILMVVARLVPTQADKLWTWLSKIEIDDPDKLMA